ncbi:DUF3854 domain-containing protein, partial [Microcoleus sp. B7-D4]
VLRVLTCLEAIAKKAYEPLPEPVRMTQHYKVVERRTAPKDKLVMVQEAQELGLYAYAKHFGDLKSGITYSRLLTHYERGGQFPKGEYDAFLAKHPEIETYWTDLEALKARCFTINGKPYLLITEGCIKAIKGCMWDIPTVAVMGVDIALTPAAKGTPDLIPGLKRLAEAGLNFIIAYDSDPPEKVETVKNVRRAEKTLTKHLKAYGCEVLSVTGNWNHEDGKGMDDFINNQGIEAFRAVLMKASNVV